MTLETAPAIDTRQLRKVFGDRAAVKGLTLQVKQGEVFGFLGPNGAGKTTSIKMLLGLTAPTSGAACLLGKPLGDRSILARTGFLPEHFRFQEWLTAREFLEMHGLLYDMPLQDLKMRIEELLARVGLSEFRHKQLRTFSKGMLQRIGLAQALINRPALVFLDEPTSGLDPVGRLLVRDIIHDLRAGGTCVFLNSHLLSEIEVTCDRVGFIKHGEVLRVLDLAAQDAGQSLVTVRASGLTPATLSGLSQWASEVSRLPSPAALHPEGAAEEVVFLSLAIPNERVLPEITRYLVAQGVNVYAVTPKHLSLEEQFIETVGKDGGL